MVEGKRRRSTVQRLAVAERHGDGRHRFLERLVQHLGARDLLRHLVELIARQREGVDRLQRRVSDELAGLMPMLAVFHEASLYKLKVGPYATRQDAAQAADQAREALQLNPMVVERR